MTTIAVIGIILAYVLVGAWVWGYACARWAGNYNLKYSYESREPSWYHDEYGPLVAAVFWPVYILFALILGRVIKFLAQAGQNKGHKSYQASKVRIELEKKIRIEQERIGREVEEEIEETIRQVEEIEETIRRVVR